MNRHFCFLRWAALGVLGLAVPAPAGEAAGGREVLSERSVWRTHVTWGPLAMKGASGVQVPLTGGNRRIRESFGDNWHSEPPPQDWAQPDFNDASWSLWRETHAAATLKGTAVRLYDTWQYGVQQSPNIRRRCLRGGFSVEDPAGVRKLTLEVVFRGGLLVYLNGREIGRAEVSDGAAKDPVGLAEAYPEEMYLDLAGKPWLLKSGSVNTLPLDNAQALENFNRRLRNVTVEIPANALRKGKNVLALDVRAVPCPEKIGWDGADWWSTCGVASIDLRSDGAVANAVERPAGIQVWTASPLTKVSPFGSAMGGRIGRGTVVLLWNFPLCWAPGAETPAPIRLVGTRNGVFSGQAVVSSGSAIRGLKVVASDLVQTGGGGKIPAADCQVGYMAFPPEPPEDLCDLSVSMLDVLHNDAPAEATALPMKPCLGMPDFSKWKGISWCEGGATVPVWLRVHVPKNAPEGEYAGTLTVSAEGLKPTVVPVALKVHGFVLPDPRDFTAHVGLVHSPDSLALQYNVPLWSDRHFELMEETCARMGELGGSTLFIPLVEKSWLGNSQTMVYWTKDGSGYKPDFRVLDRYLDLVQKHMKPRVTCLYVAHLYREMKGSVSTSEGGNVKSLPVPEYRPTPEAIAFWKPVIDEVLARLKRRGLDGCVTLGMTIEGGGSGDLQQAVDLFKAVWPEGKWADLAHYGARKGNICGVPYGFTMSVWGNKTPFASKKWGLPDLPLVVIKHYRADPRIDLRPTASRGSLYWATERAMDESQGIGPLGMDFWNFPGRGWQGRSAPLEGGITNLSMHMFSTAAFLAPGPSGPVPTARFEIFRQGLQACEARAVIQRALEGGKLSGDLAKRCEQVLKRRKEALDIAALGEAHAQGDGWAWYAASGWEALEGELFACAGEVSRAGGK